MDKQKAKRIALATIIVLILATSAIYWLFFAPFSSEKGHVYIYIRSGDTTEDVARQLGQCAAPRQLLGYKITAFLLGYTGTPHTGRYDAGNGISSIGLVRRLRNGQQAPVSLVVPNVRTMDNLAARLAHQLGTDSATFAQTFRNDSVCKAFGLDTTTLACLFIPNTYEVYWDISPDKLLQRMKKESDAYWTAERRSLAAAALLTEQQVITLASIVDQETANDAEKPMIAGMYINRLRQGMKLQADPTVKFALRRFDLKRILHEHLTVDSPYNTYQHEGLPPGPICIPAISSIEAVLHFAHHDYLYMCAKEDFSGTHAFAVTYEEHLKNAARYARALNERNIH